ncbi:MAG: glycosyltransferase involved in cell wall biosynthesis [Rhodothermales bacterium]|jgi:glycosyltransferase involved in cell wall biosynthesis
MNICHVITRMIVGGAQENTLFTARGHLEHGHQTTLVTGPTTGPEGKLLEKVRVPELRVVQIPSLTRELSLLTDYRAYHELKAHFRAEGYDVVHTHSSKAGILARIAATHAGVPLVVHTVHGPPFHAYEKAWRNRIYITAEQLAARYCRKIYTVADAMTQQFCNARIGRPEQYQTVYSGMDLQSYLDAKPECELRKSLGIPKDSLVVGKIARLFDLKGYEYLVEAAPAIVKEHPNVRFLIVGDGLLRESLEQQFTEAGVREHIVFTGLVPPDHIPRYTALMDVLVHLSLREGLPRTVVQALAAGIPAVGFPLDGTPEAILDGKTGYLCEVHNATAVAGAVNKLLRSPQLREELGSAGREHVRHKWDWHTMVDTLEAGYEKELNKSR